ncbi:hypothetical protein J2Y69_001965 [Microbacterium resistens]|uniref:Peptidoglycan binding domain-containing protein n=1 Tax=Microbacterium resistens TaxID=156977 RepID=A0ABU1SCL7_9MICO|nr:hypothetical protein [Microbacterium resistens]MDR6867362.1 hypothetical protein [Microbacterium resistens]
MSEDRNATNGVPADDAPDNALGKAPENALDNAPENAPGEALGEGAARPDSFERLIDGAATEPIEESAGAVPASEGAPEDEGAPESEGADGGPSRVSGWARVFRGNKGLWIGAAAAIVALVGGLLVGTFVLAPADAAGDAPKPGLVTVPVEFGPLSNDVTLRAEVGYADAVEVTIDTSSVSGAAVVTGQLPAAGATFSALSIALEVTGRPVIVLPGELPAYRTLRYGVSGPDVLQLKQALVAVGIDAGDAASNVFDEATANGIAQLYAQVGYPAPSPANGAEDAYRSAQEGLRSAESAVASAEAQLSAANAGPTDLQVWEADVAIKQAELAVQAARQSGQGVQEAEWALQTAQLQRQQLFAGRDTSGERGAVDAAYAQVNSAREALERARLEALPHLPSSEVLFLTELPRRVDEVKAKRGTVLQGAAMTVSGATVRLTGSAAEADARLLKAGDAGTFELPDGTAHKATITEAAPAKDGKGRWQVLFQPDPLTAEQVQQLQGSNVRVQVAVGATDGDVLSVPVAALTAGPGGESRVEIVEGDPREGEAAKTRMVVVKTGLAARGAVEVTPTEGTLEKGDLVVVGR